MLLGEIASASENDSWAPITFGKSSQRIEECRDLGYGISKICQIIFFSMLTLNDCPVAISGPSRKSPAIQPSMDGSGRHGPHG
jgi:hypothetical protein